jgi:hypothetical protein
MRGNVCAAALAVCATMAGSVRAADPSRARLTVRFEPTVAHPGEVVEIHVTALTAAGVQADLLVPLEVDTDSGKVAAPERRAPGAYVALLTVPQRLPLSRSILILARSGAISREAGLALFPGPAVTLRVEGPRECPESAETCPLDIAAEDAYGNGAEEEPTGKAELGKLLPAQSAGGGRWVMAYRPAHVQRDADDVLTVELGGQRAERRVRLLAARLRFDLAPRVGAAFQGRLGLAAGAQALGERLLSSGWLVGAGVEGHWWSGTRSLGAGSHSDRSQLAFGLLGLAERRVSSHLLAGVSAGGGLAQVTNTDKVPGQPSVGATGWAPTAFGALSLGYELSGGMPFLELRGQWVGGAHLVTIDSGPKTPLLVFLGYRLHVH